MSNKYSIAPKKDIRKIQKVDHKFITEKNKIVIIIPFYGQVNLLKEAIYSINSNYQSIDILLVDAVIKKR